MVESKEHRSKVMRAVKGKNTAPEMTVRKFVHGLGFRYRLHRKDIPGNPDLVFIHDIIYPNSVADDDVVFCR